MKHTLPIVVGVLMLGAAGLVASQQFGIFNGGSLQGAVMSSGASSSQRYGCGTDSKGNPACVQRVGGSFTDAVTCMKTCAPKYLCKNNACVVDANYGEPTMAACQLKCGSSSSSVPKPATPAVSQPSSPSPR